MRAAAKRALISLVAAFLAVLLTGCRPAQVITPASSSKRDSVAVAWRRDTVYVRDSVAVRAGGDTVFVERWRREYVERLRSDTVRVYSRDTVRSVVEVPRELTAWQKARLDSWWWLAAFAALAVFLTGWRLLH